MANVFLHMAPRETYPPYDENEARWPLPCPHPDSCRPRSSGYFVGKFLQACRCATAKVPAVCRTRQ